MTSLEGNITCEGNTASKERILCDLVSMTRWSRYEQMTLSITVKMAQSIILVEKRLYYVGPFAIIIFEMNISYL